MNRLTYDPCSYAKALGQSVAPLDYVLDPVKYEHCNKCRIELGVVGGTAVSHAKGNLVDLENNLLGIDRPNTHCPDYKYQGPRPDGVVQGREYIKPVSHPPVDTSLVHMRSCQMHDYPAVPVAAMAPRFKCP
jgi:hypothetical protein